MNLSFSYLVSTFFSAYLRTERGLSKKTIASYSDTMRLLIGYFDHAMGIKLEDIEMHMIHQENILGFLDCLERQRNNSARTRNQRLAAIKAFFSYAARKDPELLHQNACIRAIKAKTFAHQPPQSLTVEQVNAILAVPDPQTPLGMRDLALLHLLYNTGARVQEIVDLCIGDVDGHGRIITLSGKGGKVRTVPLQEETVKLITHYLQLRSDQSNPSAALFLNISGDRLTRFGIGKMLAKHVKTALINCPSLAHITISPHLFRHTMALHLIQSGRDITIVKEWLGHADIKTTSLYVQVSIERKRHALEKFPPPESPHDSTTPKWKEPALMQFLSRLSAPSYYVA